MMRCFVAIFPDNQTIENIVKIQNELKKLPWKVKLVEPENLHISLTFLGEKTQEEINKIVDDLNDISSKIESFHVVLNKILFIPNENFIRVLALNVESEIGEKLRKKIVSKIGGSSHPLHLTLARVKMVSDKHAIVNKLKKTQINEGFKVDRIFLVKSVLTKNGPIYTKISEFRLK